MSAIANQTSYRHRSAAGAPRRGTGGAGRRNRRARSGAVANGSPAAICCVNCNARNSAGARRSSIPSSLLLAIEDIEQAIAGKRRPTDKKDPAGARARCDKRRASRGALPGHLPHVDVTIAPEDTDCPCCRAPMHVIGEETSKRLDVVPAQFRVIVTHRPKYACRACTDGVVQAPAPERLIKGGLPTEAMVAHVLVAHVLVPRCWSPVLVAKYAWHLPLYRQAQMLLAQGIEIKRSVLAFRVGYAAAELQPLWLRLRESLLGAGKIAVDETTAPVLDPGRGRTRKGFFWAIAGGPPTGVRDFGTGHRGDL